MDRLWQYLDKHRNEAPIHELVATALVSEEDIDVTSSLLDEVAKRFGSGFSGSYLSSAGLSEFVSHIAATKSPKTVLDPTCGSGLLLKTVASHVDASTVHGIEIDESIVPVAERLLGGSTSIFLGDALFSDLPLLESYDLVISEPPLGMTTRRPLRLAGLNPILLT